MESKHPAFWAGHTFSVLTGTAFVISATLNALTFLVYWKLNYFLIASPADVIMSGFILVAAFGLVGAIIAGFWWLVVLIKQLTEKEKARRLREAEDLEAMLNASTGALIARLEKSGVPPEEIAPIAEVHRRGKREITKEMRGVRRGTVIAGFSILATLVPPVLGIASTLADRFFKVDAAVRVLDRPWWYATGLQAAPEYTEFNGKCANAPVAWLGSSTAILECSDRVRVIHKLDDLVTVQRYAR